MSPRARKLGKKESVLPVEEKAAAVQIRPGTIVTPKLGKSLQDDGTVIDIDVNTGKPWKDKEEVSESVQDLYKKIFGE